MEKIDPNHIIRRIPFVGGEPIPGTIVEMVYRPDKSETAFAIYEKSKVRYALTFPAGSENVVRLGPSLSHAIVRILSLRMIVAFETRAASRIGTQLSMG